jgi:hypothetical protein
MRVRPARTILAKGRATSFTGISVEHEPENGKLVRTGANRFIYTPDNGFLGKDAYIFKICASKGAQKGCSTVAFVSQVK